MSLLPQSTFKQAQIFKNTTNYIRKLNEKYDSAVQKECSAELETYNKAVSALQKKLHAISETSAHKSYVKNLQEMQQKSVSSLLQIEKDARKCIRGIQTNDKLSFEEKQKQISEISDLIAEAIMDEGDYEKLKQIQKQLTKKDEMVRIVMLQ